MTFDKAALAWHLPWDADWVTAVTFVGKSRTLAAGNNLGEILIWDLPEKPTTEMPKPTRMLVGHSNVVSRLRSSADGRWLISSSYDRTVRVWDMQAPAGKESVDLVLNARTIADAEARKNNGAKVPPPIPAKVEKRDAAKVLDQHKEWVGSFSFNKDQSLMLSGDDSGELILWNFPQMKEASRWKTRNWVYAVALSPDGSQAVVTERRPLVFDSARQASVKLWDTKTGKVIKDLEADFKGMYLSAAEYSADGKLLALGRGGECDSTGGKIFLHNPADGKRIRELTPGHLSGLTDLAFHPDGRHIASSGRDTVIRLFDLTDGKMVKELGKGRGGQFKDWICALSFTADGQYLAGGDMAGGVQVYTLA